MKTTTPIASGWSNIAQMSLHLKSPATRMFVKQLIRDDYKENIKVPHCCPFKIIPRWTADPFQKGPALQKSFHGVVMACQGYASTFFHYSDIIKGVHPGVPLGADQRKHQISTSLAFVRGIHRRPVNSPHKCPVTRKMFPFDDVIMQSNRLYQIYFVFLISP